MKNIATIIITIISIQIGFSQACGIYRIKYVGEIKNESVEINSIKLPTIQFLHGYRKVKDKSAFIETDLKDGKIDEELSSHLTSDLFDNPKRYLELYQKNRKSILIILSITKEGKEKEIPIEIAWDEVKISKIKDDKFGQLFQIDLKEIEIKEN